MLSSILGVLMFAAVIGALMGQLLLAVGIGVCLCLVWQTLRSYRLERWLGSGMRLPPPVKDEVWVNVYRQLARLRQRGRKRKRKLSRIIRQFRDASSALPDGVVVLSDDDEVLWSNPAAGELLGLHSPQDIGLRITHLVRHPKFVRFLAQRQYDKSVECPSPKNSELVLSARIKPYGKKRRLLLVKDITQLHRLDQMRRDFVANVSHELRTPLTVINGYLETFLDNPDNSPSHWRQPLERMHQQSGRMLHIIEDLLVLSRLETETEIRSERPVAVHGLLKSIIEDAIILSGEREHEIELDADQGLWIRGCEQELRSAFSNLVFNAVRYTPTAGHISVRWFADDRRLHLVVEDDGEGITAHHIPRLTERFYRVDRGRQRSRGGTGLGLAIVKHVLQRHDGELKISSQVGVGSTFACEFPLERKLKGKPLPVVEH